MSDPWTRTDPAEALWACWAEADDDGVDHARKQIEPWLPRLGELDAPKRILDVGCGVGRLLVPFGVAYPGHDWVGYDTSPTMLRHCQDAIGAVAAKDVRLAFVLGSTNDLHPHSVMEELHFDAAYSVVVIQHLAPPDVQDLFGLVGSVLVGKGVFRFQYVNETAEWGPLSWPMAAGIVEQLLYNAGLDVVGTNEDPLRPTWTWCTAVKRAT